MLWPRRLQQYDLIVVELTAGVVDLGGDAEMALAGSLGRHEYLLF
jgi:hypothetical protein